MSKNREVLSPETRTLLRSLHQGVDLETEVKAILRQFKTAPPESIAAAALQIRHDAALYAAFPGPYWLSPPKPHAKLKLLRQTPGLEFIYIFHGDGYLREASLNKIRGGLQSPFLVAAVIWRLNDWVAPVRTAAYLCAQRVFQSTPPDIIARAALDLLRRQHGWGRWGEPERSMIEELYARSNVTAELAKLLIQANDRTNTNEASPRAAHALA